MKINLWSYGVLLLVLLSSCHMDKYYADRRLPHDPPPKEEAPLAILQDDAEKQNVMPGIVLDEAPAATVHSTTPTNKKPRTTVAITPVDKSPEQKNTVPANVNPLIKQNNPVIKAPDKNQNMAVFLSLLACSLLVGLWALAYVFFTSRALWIPLSAMAIALFVTSLVFLIAQPIN